MMLYLLDRTCFRTSAVVEVLEEGGVPLLAHNFLRVFLQLLELFHTPCQALTVRITIYLRPSAPLIYFRMS